MAKTADLPGVHADSVRTLTAWRHELLPTTISPEQNHDQTAAPTLASQDLGATFGIMSSTRVALAAVIVSIVTSCAGDVQIVGDGDIVIATAGPMSGQYAVFGRQLRQGAEQAVDDLNAAGGLLGERLALAVGNDVCDPRRAVAVANQMVEKGVVFIAGHFCSGASIPASVVYNWEGIVMISPASTNPNLTEQGFGNVFRVAPRDEEQGRVAANFVVENQVGSRIAVLHDDTAYGRALAADFRQHLNARGVDEVMYGEIAPGLEDYSNVITSMQDAGVDVIYLGGYHTEAGLIVRQASQRGMQARMISGDALFTDEYWRIAGDAGQGTLMTFNPDPRKNEAAETVVKAFEARGYDPEGYTLYSYAAIQAWAQAVERAGTTDTEAVIEVLHNSKFNTVLGTIEFDEKGDIQEPTYVMYEWDRGQYRQRTD